MKLFYKIINYLSPNITPEIEKEIDRDCITNIRRVSLPVLFFEILTFVVFLSMNAANNLNHHEIVSLYMVGFCICTCIFGLILSRKMLAEEKLSHWKVMLFKISFFAALTVWGIVSDYRHYVVGEQMLTFFAVELIIVCFFLFKPWVSIVLMGGAYLLLYHVLYMFDGAAKIQIFNFIVLALISIIALIVMYHYQLHLAEKSIKLSESNAKFEQISRRDVLTGLGNRYALEEFAEKLRGVPLRAYMLDINNFKNINDKYGHIVGDEILKATAENLKKLYPECLIYRYGGDEFLVLKDAEEKVSYDRELYTFPWSDNRKNIKITLCNGKADGNPENHEQFYELISEADGELYRVKKFVHKNDNRKKGIKLR